MPACPCAATSPQQQRRLDVGRANGNFLEIAISQIWNRSTERGSLAVGLFQVFCRLGPSHLSATPQSQVTSHHTRPTEPTQPSTTTLLRCGITFERWSPRTLHINANVETQRHPRPGTLHDELAPQSAPGYVANLLQLPSRVRVHPPATRRVDTPHSFCCAYYIPVLQRHRGRKQGERKSHAVCLVFAELGWSDVRVVDPVIVSPRARCGLSRDFFFCVTRRGKKKKTTVPRATCTTYTHVQYINKQKLGATTQPRSSSSMIERAFGAAAVARPLDSPPASHVKLYRPRRCAVNNVEETQTAALCFPACANYRTCGGRELNICSPSAPRKKNCCCCVFAY